MNWRTIESAPSDKVLLCYWAAGKFIDTAVKYSFGSRFVWANQEDIDDDYREPDFWMPLPEPPQ